MPTQVDPVTERHVTSAINDLAIEFKGIYSHETIERYVRESMTAFADVKIVEFVPLLVHRHTRERLRAAGQVAGTIAKTVTEVLFVCIHNAGRSQMCAHPGEAEPGKPRARLAAWSQSGERTSWACRSGLPRTALTQTRSAR